MKNPYEFDGKILFSYLNCYGKIPYLLAMIPLVIINDKRNNRITQHFMFINDLTIVSIERCW